jgi:hypothetical protein
MSAVAVFRIRLGLVESATGMVAVSSGSPQDVQNRWSGADWQPQWEQKLVMGGAPSRLVD